MIKTKDEFSEATRDWARPYKGYAIDIPVMDLDNRLRAVEAQFQLFSKYPALASAYNEYKLIEKLILSGEQ